ncbi:UDP-N-acetylmuramate dehydrogenase [Algisphaera agarilytica]|uniref:UDP-N-acetylenolpyruvoylglucosamine reductase n=1 Tax=Algisphaera agarilytica TaxID=1385975 RepID=A0A7X0LKU1_9BACT|nr:UDP-N-acetylmuramate dehydrogenase [Algisphaera agarilytica]MBB6430199.1 UDP-N-acetylmuramate dehydrogenase [Algisphaera agarilytica]
MPDSSFTVRPDFLADLNIKHTADAPLGALTWYRTGGHAAILASPSNVAQLSTLVSRCHEEHVPITVLGAGANLLVRDEGVDAVVVRLDDPNFKNITIDEKQGSIVAGAGVDLFKLVPASARAGLDGLVHIAGIPATVGGAVRMNAGGAFGDIGESVKRVQVMSDAGQVYYRDRDDLEFNYRSTNITAPFILEVEFELTPADSDELMKRYKEIYFYKKNSQPMGDKSAGCCFKNPPAEVGATAGQLIDRAGLKGYTVGGASVSELHANFVVAEPGKTTSSDLLAVIDHVQQTIAQRHGIDLEREVVVW